MPRRMLNASRDELIDAKAFYDSFESRIDLFMLTTHHHVLGDIFDILCVFLTENIITKANEFGLSSIAKSSSGAS